MIDSKDMKLGAYAGLTGGLVFGAMMAIMGTLPMIGKMVGDPSAQTGFLVHLVISVVIGVSSSTFFSRFVHDAISALGYGLLYGGAWWFLGSLTLMPLIMGMGLGVNWKPARPSRRKHDDLPVPGGEDVKGTECQDRVGILGLAAPRWSS